MMRKPKLPPDDPEESKRFIDMAHEVDAVEPSEKFERTIRKIAPPKSQAARKVKKRP